MHKIKQAQLFVVVISLVFTGKTYSLSVSDNNEWEVYGTAQFGDKIIVGDYIGGDTEDQDGDGNPHQNCGGKYYFDYDWIISKQTFSCPFSVQWTGCFPTTGLGYNSVGLRQVGANRCGSTTSDYAIFSTNWQNYGKLLAGAAGESPIELDGINPTNYEFSDNLVF